LLAIPANAKRLLDSVSELDGGGGIEKPQYIHNRHGERSEAIQRSRMVVAHRLPVDHGAAGSRRFARDD
jgi:hypothetical protein